MAEDAGRSINPMIADGQVHGGVAQGIANALLEEIVYDETGNILTASLADYLPPTAREIPRDRDLHHLETLTDASITKAKGLGEGGAIGAPAAVINAINDALSPFGVAIDEMPATPQRIRAALRAQQERPHERQGRHHARRQRRATTRSRSSRAARWPTRSARIAARPARISAASTASAAPARCWSTASRCAPA